MIKKAIPLFLALCAGLAFTYFPEEYPLYLRTIGFSKGEIRDLKDGGIVIHGLRNSAPAEYGLIAARVINVPPYYYRDFYWTIENFKTLRNFRQIGKFKEPPDMNDLRPLELSNEDYDVLRKCKVGTCDIKLSAPEIAALPATAGKDDLGDAYREILLKRLLDYRGAGLHEPASVAQIKRFPELREYFQPTEQFLLQYPNISDPETTQMFYWAREHTGKESDATLHHVFFRSIADDFLLVDREIYNSNPAVLASTAVVHLIAYADRGAPATLAVIQQRVQTTLTAFPFQSFLRNYFDLSLKRKMFSELKRTGNLMEKRYQSAAFTNFPFVLKSRDER